jgi:hypothetical protein
MLAQARSAHPDATWVRADARALPFAEDFDLAVTFGALGHFLPTERPRTEWRWLRRPITDGDLRPPIVWPPRLARMAMSRLLGPTVAEVSGSIRLACIPGREWLCLRSRT